MCVCYYRNGGVKEQRFCINFWFKFNKTAAETHRILKEVLGEQALSQARTFGCFKCFKGGRQFRSNIKSILIIFFWHSRICDKEFVPSGQTVNGTFYCEILRLLRENVRRERPEMWKNGHHDHAAAHTSLVVRKFLTK